MIQYADIVYDTIVDGLGLRNTLYVSGCSHNCTECHNKALQNYGYGKRGCFQTIAQKLTINDNDITFSGGEPFEQAKELISIIHWINNCDFSDGRDKRNIWIYSGYTFEQIVDDPTKRELLSLCDVLVDGKFDITKKDLTLKFRGSSNQRIINIQESLEENRVIEKWL